MKSWRPEASAFGGSGQNPALPAASGPRHHLLAGAGSALLRSRNNKTGETNGWHALLW